MTFSISITTHNRVQDLMRTLAAIARLDPQPLEVIVCADGCSDDTVARMRTDWPRHRLLVHDPGRGSIVSRDRIAREASGDIVLSLDDDSHPVETDFLDRLATIFESDPSLAVVTFPQRSDEYPESLSQTDFGPALWVASYPNSGAAFRRAVYLALEGFPGFFFHAYEEPDFALQCWNAGHRVLFHPDLTIRHYFTPAMRNEVRTHHRHARNEFWSLVMRCPAALAPPLALFRAVRQAMYAARRGPAWLVREPAWWLQALRGLPTALRRRRPVPFSVYRQWLRLMRHPAPAGSTVASAAR